MDEIEQNKNFRCYCYISGEFDTTIGPDDQQQHILCFHVYNFSFYFFFFRSSDSNTKKIDLCLCPLVVSHDIGYYLMKTNYYFEQEP